VRANCVCPGWVRTPMGDDGMQEVAEKWGCSLEDAYWLCARGTPLRRPASGVLAVFWRNEARSRLR